MIPEENELRERLDRIEENVKFIKKVIEAKYNPPSPPDLCEVFKICDICGGYDTHYEYCSLYSPVV